jgi:hypothetical protein
MDNERDALDNKPLSDTEINKKLAEFMGWEKIRIWDGKDWIYSGRKPLNNISDAFYVVEKLREKKLKVLLETFLDGMIEISIIKLNRGQVANAWDESPSRAICLAAIKVIDEVES